MLLVGIYTLWITLSLSFLVFFSVYNHFVALTDVLEHVLILQDTEVFGRLVGPFDMGNEQSRPIQQPFQIPYSIFQIFLSHEKRIQCIA